MDLMSPILKKARRMAAEAKPGSLIINGKTYTFVFDQNRWVYSVYEDMEFFCDYNTKKLSVAKKWLHEYLNN